MKVSASINEIAKIAEVSCATVSRAFRSRESVSKEAYERIMRAAEELEYQPKKYKNRASISVYRSVIGVVVSDLTTQFYPKAIKGITGVAAERGIDVVICDSNDDPGREVQNLELLKNLHVNGIIFSPVADNVEFNNALVEELSLSRMPLVLLDRSLKGISLDGVFRDDYAASALATQCLIDNGHTHIAVIAGLLNTKPGLERLSGFLNTMMNAKLSDCQQVFYGDFKSESAYKHTQEILRSHKDITAIYCCNNMMTIGCIRAIRDAGLSIPEDIAVVSFGDLDASNVYSSIITSVTQPIYPLGEECARILIDKMEHIKKRGRSPARRITFESKLVLRGSEKFPLRQQRKRMHPDTEVV